MIYFAADPVIFTNEVKLFYADEIFDEALASVALDFVVYNGEANSFTYVSYLFQFKSGGNVEIGNYIEPNLFNMYDTPLDILRGFCEAALMLAFILMLIYTIYDYWRKSKIYENWKRSLYTLLTAQ